MKKILVLDDDPQILKMIKLMIEGDQFHVHCRSNGQNALQYIQENDISILMTDILMPEVDGIEVINQCRKQNIDVAIIAMSGGRRKLSADFNLKSAEMLGAQKVLAKPFTRQQLNDSLQSILS